MVAEEASNDLRRAGIFPAKQPLCRAVVSLVGSVQISMTDGLLQVLIWEGDDSPDCRSGQCYFI